MPPWKATAKGDADEALRRKQEQMIAHALWMEARDAKARSGRSVTRRKMDRLAGAHTLKAMDRDYLEGEDPRPAGAFRPQAPQSAPGRA